MKKVSVLIPTFQAESYIEQLMNVLQNQSLESGWETEIIVVDSSSQDRTMEILAKKYPHVHLQVIPNQIFDHGGTRNYMASLANGDFLLFMTQDAIPCDEKLIESLLKPFEDQEVMVSFARQIPKADAKPMEVFARRFNYPEHSVIKHKGSLKALGIKTFFNSNVCSMYRQDAFAKLGGFPEKIILNEDMVFASEAILEGYKVSYTAEARVYHSHNYGFRQQFKRYFDLGMAFCETSYLLDYASNEKEGVRMVVKQLKFLAANKKFLHIPVAILENGLKFIAYQLGKKHKYMPMRTKRKLSAYMK